MSSPAGRRSTRSSQVATPNQRSAGPSPVEAVQSSPARDQSYNSSQQDENTTTPRRTRGFQLASSPLFYASSIPESSPLRQMNQSQVTQSQPNGAEPSSPLRHQTESQGQNTGHGDGTPRASGRALAGESSPIRYEPSSSPRRNLPPSELESEGRNLFAGLSSNPGRHRGEVDRGDLFPRVAPPSRRILLDEAGRVIRDGSAQGSDPSFLHLNPNTSEADRMAGVDGEYVYGTTISLAEVSSTFREFLRSFTRKYRMWADGMTETQTRGEVGAMAKPYADALENMLVLGTNKLFLDIRDLKAYPRTVKLWHQVQAYPSEIVTIMDQVTKDCMVELAAAEMASQRTSQADGSGLPRGTQTSEMPFPSSDAATPRTHADQQDVKTLEDQVHETDYVVRPWGMDASINMRELSPSDVDRLVSVKGLVIRATPVIPDMRQAFFKCNVCGHAVKVEIHRGKIREPTECPRARCSSRNSMQIVHNRCEFTDKQVIKLQETPDVVPAGQTPHSVTIVVHDELVDFCKAGDRVEVTGIFRVTPVRVNPRQRTVKSVHKTFVDGLHVLKVDKKRVGNDPSSLDMAEEEDFHAKTPGLEQIRKISPEEEDLIRQTAAREDVYDLLSRSLAPSVYEMDDVKKGILLQLFGGTNKTFQKGGCPKYRGDINVLLCGDPSTSKSQILAYVHRIAPRGVYTSGKGSSAVGLTAYVTRDPESRQLVLESGALVLSDGGVCCIDEFDKMSDSTRSVLHEVMEQQTVSVAKAGIITTLNARTSILASANPIGSRYNPDLPVPQNIDLPPTLLSRFDLVYLILDRVDEKTDRRLARHLLSMYLQDKPDSAQSKNDILPVEFLTSYISYARAHCHPTITLEAGSALVNAYVDMRKLGQDVRAAEKRITATTRQLESMIRLAEAHAKMRLSTEVTTDDVAEAMRLIRSALKTAATDSHGRIDMSLLTEGTSAMERKRRADMKAALIRLLDHLTTGGQTVRFSDVARQLAEGAGMPVEPAEFTEAMRALEMEGHVTITGEGARKSVRRVTGVA